jgi:flagellar biosynthesis component FlhA
MDMNNMTAEEKAGFMMGVVISVVLAAVFVPLITIWAINTLFGTSIAFSFVNWFATLWITGILTTKVPFKNPFLPVDKV